MVINYRIQPREGINNPIRVFTKSSHEMYAPCGSGRAAPIDRESAQELYVEHQQLFKKLKEIEQAIKNI